jgi:DNA helicase-2/ATP-dependent DNA helicase PcrA
VLPYTPAQAEAIACLDAPLQIIACAGSGKTQVISQRISQILALPGVEPRHVVAFTFTEKAAAELKDRILSIVGQDHGTTTGLAEMYVGTMHAYCLNVLQTYVPETFKYSVLTESTQRLFIDRNSKRSGLTECPTMSPNTPTLRRYLHSRLYTQVMSILVEDEVDSTLVPAGVRAAVEKYRELLMTHAYFDYTSMVHSAVTLLDSPDEGVGTPSHALLQHVRDEVRFVVVDEYQDVNPLQERLVRGLVQFGANLCVVGDDDQTIYPWRGSQVSNILTFADRYEGIRSVTLADNFRSSKGIVALGRRVAEGIPAGHRLPKSMEDASHQTWERGDIVAASYLTAEAEAAAICDRLEDLRGVTFTDRPGAAARGLSWSDMAVLFRSVKGDAGPLVAELDRRGIPYIVKGLSRLFDSREIAAVVALFRYMTGAADFGEVERLWAASGLLAPGVSVAAARSLLDEGADFGRGDRWGTYNIQRLYLDVLEVLGVREDTVPGDAVHGELAMYQLGKFSQVISDFETINFGSAPKDKYDTFVGWLQYQAPDYYDEADLDTGYATPDAVTIATVHQAKGMQWPAVFVPCLRRNRFPAKRMGGLGVFHVLPEEAVQDADRYRGTVEDERRLFYVAATRAQKYLYLSFSPGSSSLYAKASDFFGEATTVPFVSTAAPLLGDTVGRREPQPLVEIPQVTLSFSELKYLFECPYQFKIRFLYGFNPPIHEALGYGKGLHDALAEMHKRALDGDLLDTSSVADLVARHLHTPYAYPALRAQLVAAAEQALRRYFAQHGDDLPRTIHSEKQIQVHVAPGITVDGRIDLIKRLETDEVSIVDFKSTDRAQAEDVTRDQLHVYAVGYQELTGTSADVVEVLNLDEDGKNTRETVESELLLEVRARIRGAGDALRSNHLDRLAAGCSTCATCDVRSLCRAGVPA